MTLHPKANAAVKQLIDEAVAAGREIGVQVAAYLHGELVVDAWGGMADPARGVAVDGDTLFNVFSVTKGVTATALHLQAERGLVDYDSPVALYWPEYANNGKGAVTVRDALSHRTGTPQMPEGVTLDTIGDWTAMADGCAALSPLLPIGSAAYQAFSFGWVIGEIVRRTDPKGRSFRDFVRQELAVPLGIPDLWLGIDPAVEHRVAPLINGEAEFVPPEDSLMAKAMPHAVRLTPDIYNLSAMRRACVPGTGGIFTARSCARMWAMLANGGSLDGVRLLSPERIAMACEPREKADEPDPVFFGTVMPISRGGYWQYDGVTPITWPMRSPRAIGSPGVGGSLGWADPDTGLAVAFCHNYMTNPQEGFQQPSAAIADAIREELGL
jgi:CubicO group peptidase (beta-lactamase class C family)